jgi:hypothetical protein
MKYLFFLITVFCLAACSKDLGIGRNDVFLKDYSWAVTNLGADFIQTKDNGYAVAATIFQNTDSMQMCLFKTDDYGNLNWAHTWTQSPKSWVASIAEDKDGNLYLLGTYYKTPTNTDMLLCCYKPTGELLWSKTYGSTANEDAKDIIIAEDGSIMMIATTDAQNTGNQNPKNSKDILLLKANAKADSIWTRVYGGSGEDVPTGISEKFDQDGFLIIGSTTSFSEPDQAGSNILLISTNTAGVEISKKTFGGMGADYGGQVEMPDSHNIYLTGTVGLSSNQNQVTLINTTEDIQTVNWSNHYGGSQSDIGQSLTINPDKTIAITGTTYSFGDGTANALLIKVDANGNKIFDRNYGSSGAENGKVIRTPKNGTGYIILFNSTIDKSTVISLLRTDADGTLKTN